MNDHPDIKAFNAQIRSLLQKSWTLDKNALDYKRNRRERMDLVAARRTRRNQLIAELPTGAGAAFETTKQSVDRLSTPDMSPIDRLKLFCSVAMSGEDWLDFEPIVAAVEAQIPQTNS